jgi:hypothetical protein
MYEGITKVCDDFHEVERLCYQGYRLIQIIHDDCIDFAAETTEERPEQYQPSRTTHTVNKPIVRRRALFVMLQGADEALAAKEVARANAEHKAWEAHRAAEEAKRKAAEQTKLAEKLTRDNEELDRSVRARAEEHGRLRDSNRKLEIDLGKVRKAVGEIRMKEILEGP